MFVWDLREFCNIEIMILRKNRTKHLLYILVILLLLSSSLQSYDLLQDVVKAVSDVKKLGKLPVVIFDLDGTLFDNGPRSKKIFLEFAEEKGDSKLTQTIETIDAYTMKYKVRESLIDVGIEDPTVLKEIIDSWRGKFFTNEYLKYDEPLPGAVEFVNELRDSCALIIYLTGRDAPGSLEGTISALKTNKYPIGVCRTELIMKPERFMKTLPYKKKTLKYIEKLGTVVAVFENEPANINLLFKHFPESIPFFLDTNHKPNAPPVNEEIHYIKNYNRNGEYKEQ